MGELNEDYYVVTHEPQYTDRARTDEASQKRPDSQDRATW